MNEATIIFPHQLFEQHPALKSKRPIYLVEEPHFFTRYRFHKQKLVLHKATMIEYEKILSKNGYQVTTVSLNLNLYQKLREDHIDSIHCTLLYDQTLEKSLLSSCKKEGITVTFYESPYFMTSPERFKKYFDKKDSYFFTSFYREQRIFFNILMTKEGKPQGGTLTFDKENRQRLPRSLKAPSLAIPSKRASVEQAQSWVQQFANHPGHVDAFMYPTTFAEAKEWLTLFLEERLVSFGTYQDALSPEDSTLFHSVLSPILNIGLLTPAYVIEETLSYAENHRIPLNSLEGFIRQIIGWREFVYGVYAYKSSVQQQTNYFNHRNKLPHSFWTGTTGIEPIDITIQRLLKTAYANHIERLMLFGNMMLLCEIDPHEAYIWFMELFIDSYDWVMIPNVFGMSQYADGGLMTTKPYISGANYLKKMSTYQKGPWEDAITALYWRFIALNKLKLSTIPRMSIILSLLEKTDHRAVKRHIRDAELFLNNFLKDTDD